MKRKAILTFAALLMVVSGVAAVSAYEAHMVNVTAHVENALTLDTDNISMGGYAAFPQEVIKEHFNVSLSTSFKDQDPLRVKGVTYKLCAEWKLMEPMPSPAPSPIVPGDSDGKNYYAWLGNSLWVGVDPIDNWPITATTPGDLTCVGTAPGTIPGAKDVLTGETLSADTSGTVDLLDKIDVVLYAPAFQDGFNSLTDVPPTHWPVPEIIPDPFHGVADPELGVDLGVDLKIQVTGYTY